MYSFNIRQSTRSVIVWDSRRMQRVRCRCAVPFLYFFRLLTEQKKSAGHLVCNYKVPRCYYARFGGVFTTAISNCRGMDAWSDGRTPVAAFSFFNYAFFFWPVASSRSGSSKQCEGTSE